MSPQLTFASLRVGNFDTFDQICCPGGGGGGNFTSFFQKMSKSPPHARPWHHPPSPLPHFGLNIDYTAVKRDACAVPAKTTALRSLKFSLSSPEAFSFSSNSYKVRGSENRNWLWIFAFRRCVNIDRLSDRRSRIIAVAVFFKLQMGQKQEA